MARTSSRKRGRPRAYDPDTALAQAMATFWESGFAATTLEDLTERMNMNRPSLYGAFGDKRALYGQTITRYRAMRRAARTEALAEDRPLREGLRRFYHAALDVYCSGEHGARGSFLIGTTLTEAVLNEEARGVLRDALRETDAAIEARLRHAQTRGELPETADVPALARIASAMLHTLGIRARSGETREALEAMIEPALDVICLGRGSGG